MAFEVQGSVISRKKYLTIGFTGSCGDDKRAAAPGTNDVRCSSRWHEQGRVHTQQCPPPRVEGRAVPPSQVSHHWFLPDVGTSVQLAEQMCFVVLQIISEPLIFIWLHTALWQGAGMCMGGGGGESG